MKAIEQVDVVRIETMSVSNAAAAAAEAVVEMQQMEEQLSAPLACVCTSPLSPLYHLQYVAVFIVDAQTVFGDSLLVYI